MNRAMPRARHTHCRYACALSAKVRCALLRCSNEKNLLSWYPCAGVCVDGVDVMMVSSWSRAGWTVFWLRCFDCGVLVTRYRLPRYRLPASGCVTATHAAISEQSCPDNRTQVFTLMRSTVLNQGATRWASILARRRTAVASPVPLHRPPCSSPRCRDAQDGDRPRG